MRGLWIAVLGAALTIAVIASPSFAAAVPVSHSTSGSGPSVFTMTNAVAGNQVVAYERSPSGGLTWVANFSTGGNGTGASLADQGSLVATADHHWLLVVDAGSNQISVFRLSQSGGMPWLTLTDVVASGGVLPVSLTVHNHVVFVLNDGSSISQGNVAGFRLSDLGVLHPIAGSTQPLSTVNPTGAAQVSFNPAGTLIAVTEKATNLIDVYAVNSHGVTMPLTSHNSQGVTPYGFAFTPSGKLVVSEAVTGSLSSYAAGPLGYWKVVSSSVNDLQGAPCWVVITPGGAIAYTSNAHSNSISSYSVGAGGKLALLQSVAAVTDASPTDLALTAHGHFLYVYNAAGHDIEGYEVHSDGTLTWVVTTGSLTATAEGLVAI
jgi:6-phosphogluconolactonase